MNRPFVFDVPKISDDRGNLSFLQEQSQIPFCVKRVYWIYDVPGGELYGDYALRNTQEIVISLSGSFVLRLNDGEHEQEFSLKRSYQAVCVPALYWRRLEDFSTNALAVVVSSDASVEEDYIRDFGEFLCVRENA